MNVRTVAPLAVAAVTAAALTGSAPRALAVLAVCAVAGAVAWAGRPGERARRAGAVDDRRFRQAVERLGAAFATRDRDAIVDVILETAELAVRADAAVLFVTPGGDARLTARAARGVALTGLGLAAGTGVAGRAARDDAPRWWPDGPGLVAGEPPATTAVAVPIHSAGRLLGVVAAYSSEPGRRFSADEVATLVTVVHQAETAIDNVLLHEEAERLSITDGLTGVWNRRHLDLRLAEELRRSRRFHEPFGFVLVDVDDFRRVNERLGHPGGDAVLVELAARLTAAVREVDTVARFGGEEFALLLPRTDAEGALALAQKVCELVAATPFTVDDADEWVTVSAGAGAHPRHGAGPRELVAAVDAALYRAKRAGKNRAELAGTRVAEGSPG